MIKYNRTAILLDRPSKTSFWQSGHLPSLLFKWGQAPIPTLAGGDPDSAPPFDPPASFGGFGLSIETVLSDRNILFLDTNVKEWTIDHPRVNLLLIADQECARVWPIS